MIELTPKQRLWLERGQRMGKSLYRLRAALRICVAGARNTDVARSTSRQAVVR